MNTTKTKKMKKADMSSPTEYMYNKIKAVFGGDPRVDNIVANYDTDEVFVYCNDEEFAKLLSTAIEQTDYVSIRVLFRAEGDVVTDDDIIYLFEENPHFQRWGETEDGDTYILFKPEVVQFYADNPFHPNRLETHLMEDLVGSLINRSFNFITAKKED